MPETLGLKCIDSPTISPQATIEWTAYRRSLGEFFASKWKERWTQGLHGRALAFYRPVPAQEPLELHRERPKWFTAALTQLRTEKIGFQEFLYKMKVPGIESPICQCQQEKETVKHFLLGCATWESQRRKILGSYRFRDIRIILNTRKGSLKAVKFLLATGRLEQFKAVTLQEENRENQEREEGSGVSGRWVEA